MRETAKVRLIASANNWIEGAAVQQLEKTASLPGMRLAVGLPDLHPGKGSPIGAAFAVEGYLYPSPTPAGSPICPGLWFAEKKFRRIDGYRELSRLIDILDAQFGSLKVISRTA